MTLKDISASYKRYETNSGKTIRVVAIADGNGDAIRIPLTAFGDLAVAESTPVVQLKFTSGIITHLTEIDKAGTGTGAITGSNFATASSGGTAGGLARISSRRVVRYSTGQGTEIRMTAVFTAGVAGTSQCAGFGSSGDALAFGFNGTSFGVLRRHGGCPEVRVLNITAAASGSGNLTITLHGGTGVVVAVTAGDTVGEVARKIANADYSGEGGGWRALYGGNHVAFISADAEARTGAYTLGVAATGVTGSFAQELAGVAPTEVWTAQADWNLDPCDGTRAMPVLDPTKGNVYKIAMQWLGFGAIEYAMEEPVSGSFVTVHRESYANANTTTSLTQPDQPLFLEASNGATSSTVSVKSPSMAAFNLGRTNFVGATRHSVSNTKSIATTYVPIISVHVGTVNVNGLESRVRAIIDGITFGNNGGKTAEFRLILNATLIGTPSWSTPHTDSIVETDTAATATTGGQRLYTTLVGAGSGRDVKLDPRFDAIILGPGDILTVTAALASGSAADLIAAFTYLDDI